MTKQRPPRRPKTQNVDVYSLPGTEGELRFSYPKIMTAETKREAIDWLELMKNKLDRVPAAPETEEATPQE